LAASTKRRAQFPLNISCYARVYAKILTGIAVLFIYSRNKEIHTMARKKRSSTVLQTAQTRAAALGSIDPALDLGHGLTLEGYRTSLKELQTLLDTYNTRLSELDGILNDLKASEKKVTSFSTRMLAGVGVAYGKDSNEYEQAGGTRTSEVK